MDSGCGSVGRAVPSDNRNSNPVIGKFYLPTINCIKRALKRQNIKYRKKWANPGLFLVYFRSFSNKHFNFSNKQCNKWPCSIWCLGSNLQPSDCELHPITIRPGLPPSKLASLLRSCFLSKLINPWGAAIAQWIRLCLTSYCPGFESQAQHQCFYQLIFMSCRRDKYKQK